MKRILPVLFMLAGCRTASPAVAPEPTPSVVAYDWKRDGALRQEDAEARCRQEHPECARPFASYTMPPSPCAHQGARCMEPPTRNAGTWVCGCDACTSSSDCQPSEHCGSSAADPCSHERTALRCLAGPALPPPGPCLDPPSSRVP